MTAADSWFPTPPDYDHAPELGVLAILVHVLEGVSMTMLAANRELLDDERPDWPANLEDRVFFQKIAEAFETYSKETK